MGDGEVEGMSRKPVRVGARRLAWCRNLFWWGLWCGVGVRRVTEWGFR